MIARFWVENLGANTIKTLRLSLEPCEDRPPDSPPPQVRTNSSGWPEAVTWRGMSQPLFLPGYGDFLAVEVKGFAPRSLLADIRYGGARREELRQRTLEEVPAQDAGRALVVETPHTIRYTQSLRHPRLQWGTRVLEVCKRQPRSLHAEDQSPLLGGAGDLLCVVPSPHGLAASPGDQRSYALRSVCRPTARHVP